MKGSGTASPGSLSSPGGAPRLGGSCGKAEQAEVDKGLNRMCSVCLSREVTEINDILGDIFRLSLIPYS